MTFMTFTKHAMKRELEYLVEINVLLKWQWHRSLKGKEVFSFTG